MTQLYGLLTLGKLGVSYVLAVYDLAKGPVTCNQNQNQSNSGLCNSRLSAAKPFRDNSQPQPKATMLAPTVIIHFRDDLSSWLRFHAESSVLTHIAATGLVAILNSITFFRSS